VNKGGAAIKKDKFIGKIFGIALVGLMIGAMLPLGGFAFQSQVLAQEPKAWYVDDDFADYPAADFTKIQEAVDAASSGDTIIVYPGTYTENVDVNKDHLTIQSENGAEATIVQAANPDDHVFEVTADYVNISGFTLEGATGSAGYGIYLDYADHCEISNNMVLNSSYGIYLNDSSYNSIASNIVESCAESGIILDYSPTPGPYLPAVGYNDPDDQWIDEPLAYDGDTDTFASVSTCGVSRSAWLELFSPKEKSSGIRFWIDSNSQLSHFRVELFYDGNWYYLKEWSAKGEWVVVDYLERKVEKARFYFYRDSISSGCSQGCLSEFQFKTTLGISSSNNEIVRNTVSDSGVGIRLRHSSNNKIYLNNFINNTDNGYSSDSSNVCNSPEQITYNYNGNAYTSYLGNYWSDYGVYSPAVGHNDPGDQWEDETLAYDENRDTFARVYLGGGMGSSPLELLAPSGKPTEGIRFWGSGGPLCVDIYYDGYWHCLQDWPWGISSAPANEWVELTYPSKIVEMARIIFHGRVLNGWSYLNEFQFKTVLDKSVLDVDGDGIGDTSYSIDSDKDNYPLVEPFENYELGPENQPPIASFTYSPENPFSGDVVSFDASSSHDLDGTIVTYEWDFGDGETATGCAVSHRFRGAMNESKDYTVALTVEDNSGAIATGSCDVTVTPLEKTVEVTHEPAIPVPGQPVFARMTALYNWIHDDTYVVSRIQYESGGFIGVGAISIWDFHSYEVPVPKWAADIFSFGSVREESYSPILEEIHYGGDVFQGVVVDAFDAMNVYIAGWAGISISIGPSLPAPFFETNSACFQPDYTEAPDVPIEAPSFDLAHLCSPGELRVYDSGGRVTGLVNGEVKEEIPYSVYNDGTIIIICSSPGSYRYEVEGTGEGSYGLELISVGEGETITFTATDIPTASGAVHQYTIDWDALSRGEEGVTVQVDSDGDGITDYTLKAGNVLTGDEFLPQSPGCFIATAAYGTPMAEEIQILREFRDEYLLTNPVGQALVGLYYRVSPPIAEFITEHPSLKPIVRAGLVPAVTMSTVAVNTTPAEKTAILGLLALVSVAVAIWVTRRRGRGPEYT